ncbi:polysaccharide deacetylase family protein [Sciscionella sediminilitoris]|uniref:polysaccharide deacetylase family protein n=1 Tax=Sciscionella sediminilitoris TaxID=1445613 RepID=UPI00068D1E22|nr:polysaccharide deacetylase family protein [Sciscionella sp. SE31]
MRKLLVFVLLLVFVAAFGSVSAASATKPTVVTLTFDDGNADQTAALPILRKYGMVGTFYIITGSVGEPNYLTRAELDNIAAAGNEIGGHTVTHPDLTTLPADEVMRQACLSRSTLAGWGYRVTSFAYPYAAANSAAETAVANCGYNSARGLGDIASAYGCKGCPRAETLPPRDPYWLRALDEVDPRWTLAQLQDTVTKARAAGGGLLPFTFHHICDACDELAISPALLDRFLGWLSTQSGVQVKTMDQAIGGQLRPIVNAPPGTNTGLVNASLENPAGGTGLPDCWMEGGWGSNSATFRRTTDAHSGSSAEEVQVTNYQSGDAKLLPTMDLGSCTPNAVPGTAYQVGSWYKSTGITQFALYYRNSAGGWAYWTSSPWFAAEGDWTQASWTTPPLPADATAVSFGLALIANGTLVTDDYSFGPAR